MTGSFRSPRVRPRRMQALMLLALLLVGGTAASAAAVERTPEATIARASGTLVYLESVAGETPYPITDVFVVSADGSGRRRVTRDQVDAYALEWSPDGRRFVFATSPRSRGNSIWIMNTDGSRRRRLLPPAGSRTEWQAPSWSPDGRKIYYTVRDSGTRKGIYVIDADGGHRRRLTRKQDYVLSWSPDRRRLAFVRIVLPKPRGLDRPELWVMNADGTGQRRLYSRLGHDDELGLSPDWRKLAVDRERRSGSVHELYVMNIDGSEARQLARGSDYLHFSWSRSSREIAFERDNGSSWGEAIWVADANGSNQRRLVSRGRDPMWSPDGRLIAFASKGGISVMSSNGGARRLLVSWDGEITNIRWAPTS